MNILSSYKDSSNLTTHPVPQTDHSFIGLDANQNNIFKIWLGLVGENESEIAADQQLEISLVKAFKEQSEMQFSPARDAALIDFSILLTKRDIAYAEWQMGCKLWQAVDWVPTQNELVDASREKIAATRVVEKPVRKESVRKPVKEKSKERPVKDIWTMDLFGETA